MRTIDPTTTARRERCVVGSLLQYPGEPWGPNTSTAIAYAGAFWDDPTAGRIAEAIGKCVKAGRPTTGPTVAGPPELQRHPSFGSGGGGGA